MKKLCLHVFLGVPTGSKNGPYPNCQLRLICFIRANVVKIIKKQSNPTHSIQYKANIKIFSLARNILVVDGHFSVFPSIRINLGSFFRMEHRAHQNPHCRFILFRKKNRNQSLKSTKEATWSSACVMTKESCRSSSIMCRSRKAYKLFFLHTQKKKEIKFYFRIVMKWFKLSRGLFEKHVSFAKASCKKKIFSNCFFFLQRQVVKRRFFSNYYFFFSKDQL